MRAVIADRLVVQEIAALIGWLWRFRSMATQIMDSKSDPVFVGSGMPFVGIELRIGESKPGQSRFAYLSPKDARLIAYALLTEATKAEGSGTERTT
jgi:hypothetical protein